MALIMEKAPTLANDMSLDRAWVWYTGPSLAGKENESKRQVLKDAGFRFAKKGRMVDGRLAHWAHSCHAPTPSRPSSSTFKKSKTEELSVDDAMALMNLI
jgi:hypothetical protein